MRLIVLSKLIAERSSTEGIKREYVNAQPSNCRILTGQPINYCQRLLRIGFAPSALIEQVWPLGWRSGILNFPTAEGSRAATGHIAMVIDWS